jgi:hypothetical protein
LRNEKTACIIVLAQYKFERQSITCIFVLLGCHPKNTGLSSAKTLSPSSLPTAWAFNFSAFNIYIEDKSPIQLHSEA